MTSLLGMAKKVRVKSLQGTEDNSCKCCGSWRKHWSIHNGGVPALWCRGCGVLMPEKDLVGGHVFKVNSTDHKWYVVPLCKSCNNSKPFEFDVKLKELVWVEACEKKG